MSSFNYGCTLCEEKAVIKISKSQGYSDRDYYLCKECLPEFVITRRIKKLEWNVEYGRGE